MSRIPARSHVYFTIAYTYIYIYIRNLPTFPPKISIKPRWRWHSSHCCRRGWRGVHMKRTFCAKMAPQQFKTCRSAMMATSSTETGAHRLTLGVLFRLWQKSAKVTTDTFMHVFFHSAIGMATAAGPLLAICTMILTCLTKSRFLDTCVIHM